jgi:hypothetical protein
MRTLLLLVGIVAILMGGLWVGQGTGYVHWPASSFMISQMKWAYYGAALAFVGLLLVIFSRRGA